MTAFTCPNCAGRIEFNTELQSMRCEYCDTEITIDDYKQALSKMGRMVVNEKHCPQCGANLITTDNTVSTFCSYCGSSVTLDSRLTDVERPDMIIPFKVSKKKAMNIYEAKIRETLLAPDWMRDPTNTSKFRGIYMPYHILRFSGYQPWSGTGKSYSLERRGHTDYDVTRTYQVEGTATVDYSFIPVDASAAFPDSMARAVCPYRPEREVDFEVPYYAGFYADRGDVSPDVYLDKYQALVKQDMTSQATVSAGPVSVPASEVTKGLDLKATYRTSMFPVWFLSYRNKDKINYACVNGDTGELAVDIPFDFGKFLKAVLIVAALFSVILNLFFTMKPDELLIVAPIFAMVVLVMANNLLNDTYRRLHHLDDAGYIGRDPDVVKIHMKRSYGVGIAFRNVLIISMVLFVIMMALAMFDAGEELIELIISGCTVAMPSYLIWAWIQSKQAKAKIKRKVAPIWYKALVLLKPALAIIACAVVTYGTGYIDGAAFPLYYVDEYCYFAVLFSLVMILWTAFDVVRYHNKFTMRDIPIFNEKRGGDE